ncbi:MAG: hypothetical protein GVY06_08820, partial [Alphaproteobacteria bacterium]|nr:hypothetical protein [Alphaproteobacteria bacterium]
MARRLGRTRLDEAAAFWRRSLREKVQLVWFKRDLRASDHRALAGAAAQGPVLPLFIAEPELWQGPDHSARQWSFVG